MGHGRGRSFFGVGACAPAVALVIFVPLLYGMANRHMDFSLGDSVFAFGASGSYPEK